MKSPKVIIKEGVYCYNLDTLDQCAAYNQMDCKVDCPARIGSLQALLKLYKSLAHRSGLIEHKQKVYEIAKEIGEEQDKQIRAAWNEDMHRGSKGGGSSESNSNARAGLKQTLKDNRPINCKFTKTEREEIKVATEEWEAKNGKLPRLSRSMLSRSKNK